MSGQENEIVTTDQDDTGTTIAITEKQMQEKMSSKLVAEIDDFVTLSKDWTDLALGLEEKFFRIKELAEKEGINERMIKDFISAKLKPVLSYYKSQKLMKELFKKQEVRTAIDASNSNDDDVTTTDNISNTVVDNKIREAEDAVNEGISQPQKANIMLVDFPHRLLNRLTNAINERKEAGQTFTTIKIEGSKVINIIS